MEYCNLETAKEIVKSQFTKAINDLNLLNRGFQIPTVIWKEMGIRRGGFCNYSTNVITLNTNYLKSKDWKQFLDCTPLHELAHAIAWQIYFSHGHNSLWKSICRSLGISDSRCHSFATPEIDNVDKWKRKRYEAHCSCRKHIITSVKYNRMKKGIKYICVKCHGELSFD